MALLGKRKAALLLMNLDVATGTQLLERFDSETVQEIFEARGKIMEPLRELNAQGQLRITGR